MYAACQSVQSLLRLRGQKQVSRVRIDVKGVLVQSKILFVHVGQGPAVTTPSLIYLRNVYHYQSSLRARKIILEAAKTRSCSIWNSLVFDLHGDFSESCVIVRDFSDATPIRVPSPDEFYKGKSQRRRNIEPYSALLIQQRNVLRGSGLGPRLQIGVNVREFLVGDDFRGEGWHLAGRLADVIDEGANETLWRPDTRAGRLSGALIQLQPASSQPPTRSPLRFSKTNLAGAPRARFCVYSPGLVLRMCVFSLPGAC